MVLKWNLEELFENRKSFYQKIENVRKRVASFKKYKDKNLDSKVLQKMLEEKWNIKEQTNDILIYGSLCYYQNINDKECIDLKNCAEKFNAEVELELTFVDNKILKAGKEKIEKFLEENSKLETYKFYLENLFRLNSHVLDENESALVKEEVNHINELLMSYNKENEVSFGIVEIDGKEIEITKTNFIKYISSKNRDTRKKVFILVNNYYMDRQDIFAKILGGIFSSRIKISKKKKYSSVLENVLYEENIDEKVITSLIEATHKNLNCLQDFLAVKIKSLGLDDVHFYDLAVPLKGVEIKYSLEEAVDIIKGALKPLGEKYIEVVNKLLDGHIDAMCSENKHQSITFSWGTYSFLNFKGTFNDLKNLIHELGHIVNYYLSNEKLPYIYQDSTIFVGEISSIVNEILLIRYLSHHAKNDEEKTFYLSKEIQNYYSSVYVQVMYTEYENELYRVKNHESFNAKFLGDKYSELVKKYYGENIIYDEEFKVEWCRLGHIFRWSYYPYKYATGLLIASSLVNHLLDEKTLSLKNYIQFLSLGNSMYSMDLLKVVGIDLTDLKVFDDGFEILKKDIIRLKEIMNKEGE